MEYIRKRKLTKASYDILTSHNAKILDIALKYGFSSEEAFIRAFKKQFGVTPGSYRTNRQVIALQERANLMKPPTRQLFTRIHSNFLPVSDINASVEWYTGQLGMKLIKHWIQGADLMYNSGKTMLTLIESDTFRPLHFIEFLCSNPERTRNEMIRKGLPVTELINIGTTQTFDFFDTDGHRFSVWNKSGESSSNPCSDRLLTRIDRNLLPVTDLRRSISWYADILEFELLHDWESGADLRPPDGETLLTLIEQPDMKPLYFNGRPNLITCFNLLVRDLDYSYQLLQRKEVEVTPIIDEGVIRTFHFLDPYGHPIGVCYEKENSIYYNT
ncbi:VOC family protein [Paenibacillus alkalitolerans]|uniref:VOC family protein n=1 Tax=Paenibacillus alkalitolerans TaxID=2799335 RepID=UPI0018F300C8|nr:VOC family protein [Paenibacillus alkalitolerans]